jgi:hypothetical protein
MRVRADASSGEVLYLKILVCMHVHISEGSRTLIRHQPLGCIASISSSNARPGVGMSEQWWWLNLRVNWVRSTGSTSVKPFNCQLCQTGYQATFSALYCTSDTTHMEARALWAACQCSWIHHPQACHHFQVLCHMPPSHSATAAPLSQLHQCRQVESGHTS